MHVVVVVVMTTVMVMVVYIYTCNGIPHCEIALIDIAIRFHTSHYWDEVVALLVEAHRVRHGCV